VVSAITQQKNSEHDFLQAQDGGKKAESALKRVGADPGTERSQLTAAVALLRKIGPQLASFAGSTWKGIALQELELLPAEWLTLAYVANLRAKTFSFFEGFTDQGQLVTLASSSYEAHACRLVWAAQGLWMILEGRARLLRCMAPAAGRGTKRCDAYFVSGGAEGRPRKYCSDRCTRRLEQRKRRSR
jgi:hypothetical protein